MKIKTMRNLQHASVIFLITILNATTFSSATTKEFRANNDETLALLKWKSSLDKHSQLLLSSWGITKNASPSNQCNSWFGIGCNKDGRVDNITIEDYGLRGKLSDLNFSSLHHLAIINLYNNSLYGTIPSQIGSLGRLTTLRLTYNSLSGKIPAKLCQLANLRILFLGNNKLVGTIPQEIGSLKSLTNLSIRDNELDGIIPREIGLLSSLTALDFSKNHLSGSIPSSIGNLSSLNVLKLFNNTLNGTIPREIGLLNSLTELMLWTNNLSGSIPSSIGNLSSLIAFLLWGNQLGGPLPISLNNITKLEVFDISDNYISGQLPDNICKSGSLILFQAVRNNFTGHVPKTIKTCTSLQRLRLDSNHLTGNVSKDFGVYPDLDYIDLSYNNFYGEVSQNWGSCQNLTALKISNNNISGRIPAEIRWAQKLQKLDLSSNHLTGEVPRNMGILLSDINLNNNELLGSIPSEIGDLPNLNTLNLAANNLSGLVPMQLSQCLKLRTLNLSSNRLAGYIPFEIGNFLVLEILDLAQNLLSGKIPEQLVKLIALQTLNLSHNQFSGSIPFTFGGMTTLISIDFSYNRLEGPIPNTKTFQQFSIDAFIENKDLCGNITGLKACLEQVKDGKKKKNGKETTLIIASALSFSLLVLVIVGFLFCRRNKLDKPRENNEETFSVWSYDGNLVYENIIEDTENFDEKYCIGMGGTGDVYKVEQPSGQIIAVKKLHSVERGELNNEKAFISEIRALTEIRHRNIVKLYGFCSHSRHSFLVYEFLEGGDLHKILIDEYKATEFEWTKRIDIIKGVANGLSYMHHECSPPIVHRDISSKNILLDTEYVAHISDFGTARILKTNSTYCTSFAGTFGYAAPELAQTMEVNEMQDVYSFGVLTLEVLMGRHPGDLVSHFSFSSETADEFKSTPLKDVLDPRLPIPRTIRGSEEIVCSLKLAFACLQIVPHHRPTMKQVSTELSKQRPNQYSLFTMTLGELFDSDF